MSLRENVEPDKGSSATSIPGDVVEGRDVFWLNTAGSVLFVLAAVWVVFVGRFEPDWSVEFAWLAAASTLLAAACASAVAALSLSKSTRN